MTSEPRVPRLALALFASLYALQGVTVAYLLNYNKKYMIDAGVDERVVALVQSLVLMTLVFKFLLGPLSDRVQPVRPGASPALHRAGAGAPVGRRWSGLGLIHPGEAPGRLCR